MKKIISALLLTVFAANIAFAQQEVFLTLTKYEEAIERLPTNVTVITQEQIEKSNAASVADLLQSEVGINVRQYGSIGSAASVSIRGADSKHTLVLLDGRRINDAGLGSADWTALPLVNIERIEIIRGAGAAVYGTNGFGGVVNIITKRATPKSPLVDANISYGSFNTFTASLTGAYSDEKHAILAAASNISSDGDRESSNFRNFNGFFNTSYNVSEKVQFNLTGNIYEGILMTPGSAFFAPYEARQNDSSRYAKLDSNILLNEDSSLLVSVYGSAAERRYRDTYGSDDNYTNETVGTQADYVWKKLLVGAEWWNEQYEKKDNIVNVIMTDKSRVNSAVYAQYNLELGKFSLIPTLRGDSNSSFGEVFTPAVSAVYNLNEKIKFSANSGRVWRAPSFSELYDDYIWGMPDWDFYGNPDLKPEYGISSDIGAEYVYKRIKLVVSAYYIATDNLINTDFIPSYGTTYVNVDKTRQYGFEFAAGYITNSWLSHNFNYTYLKAEDAKTGKTLSYRPESTINYDLTVKPVKDLSITASNFYRSSQLTGEYTGSPRPQKLDGFYTLDLNINYSVDKNLGLWLKGLNLTNTKYEMMSGYPMPGAVVYGGVRYAF
ncbi:MAG: TonB-dependent receptor [Endomicrobia bacterium]|nr:TonB-dependent receptor [Endomicrobiia bacterium]MCL2506617.1 TonB-dependent receptor [Endomicrobiia bacterium]